jgi:hypothetical protein
VFLLVLGHVDANEVCLAFVAVQIASDLLGKFCFACNIDTSEQTINILVRILGLLRLDSPMPEDPRNINTCLVQNMSSDI